ncbi:MAG: type VI secretion system secreted protein VgrG [Pirellulaceae bacterium]|jgi:type VI secretion system secreted protein VgrG
MSQDNRLIAIETPLGKDQLRLRAFSGVEEMSRLFSFQVEMVYIGGELEKDKVVKKLVGQNVSVRIDLQQGKRYFNGHLNRITADYGEDGGTVYRAEMVPWFWFLTQTSDCKIFQDKDVKKIIEDVLGESDFSDKFEMKLEKTYPKLEYCVQYRETDFNFISRLMEQFGIFFYFKHDNGSHKLVIADTASGYDNLSQSTVDYPLTQSDSTAKEDHIRDWERVYEFISGKWAQTDYDFKKPSTSLLNEATTKIQGLDDSKKYEVFDYPGEYVEKSDGKNETTVRMEEEEVAFDKVTGSSICRAFTTGAKFKIGVHPAPSENEKGNEYLLTSVSHNAREAAGYVSGSGATGGSEYTNRFSCIPADVTFRPARITPKPLVSGVQPAIVVGPSGEEIHTDEYGRIKVQFYWDRYGKNDQKSSCFIRTSQSIAGKKWGFMAIPRIGQEVVVDFLEGDPDRPLIVGCVYNAEQMPAYDPKEEASKIYLKSNSTKGGEGFNELMFDDKKDSERVFVHAQKNMDVRVLNDSKSRIYGNRHQIIGWEKDGKKGGSQYETIYQDKQINVKRNQDEHIEGNYKLMVGKGEEADGGNRFTVIEKNDETTVGGEFSTSIGGHKTEAIGADNSLTVGANDMTKVGTDHNLTVGANSNNKVGQNWSVDAGMETHLKSGMNAALEAGMAIHVKAGMNLVLEGGIAVTLKCGGSFISLSPAGVFISGPLVGINSGGAAGSGAGCKPKAPKAPEKAKDSIDEAAPVMPKMAHDHKTGYPSNS